ncbi:Leucine-rich_repeat domain superfamily [Hexamita inflata]|uniref:Leucine-rich repeat domain superfamily n=1 Tax=Hexamita inflata TaxID=28002 RepID=A0AA86Q3P3_9EUKA|nr:Leucine-rich repeat domain superfamily [Hexamita inflata]
MYKIQSFHSALCIQNQARMSLEVVEPLQNLINLKELNLSSNYIKEFSSLQHHPNFDSYVVNKQK